MQVGLAPELTQAAYRVGDSTTNIITPLMPYFPLVAYCQRYVRNAGIGTVDLDDAALQPRVHHDLDDLPAAVLVGGAPARDPEGVHVP